MTGVDVGARQRGAHLTQADDGNGLFVRHERLLSSFGDMRRSERARGGHRIRIVAREPTSSRASRLTLRYRPRCSCPMEQIAGATSPGSSEPTRWRSETILSDFVLPAN
ncbi:hypothetical protein [Nannocystis pusilla]|uniref:hypothetical protein n=1 Tax=Nannocystis pusilla TaxID=889268 RepID=UPI003DA3EAB6